MKRAFSYQTSYQSFKASEREKILKLKWTNYFKKGINIGGIRPFILNSWERSQSHNLNPDLPKVSKICNAKEIDERRANNEDTLQLIRPFMDDLFDIVKGTDSIIAFSDKDGVVLEMFGDNDIAMNAASVNFKVGVNMNEKMIGTNAIGTSIELEHPIQVIGAEHYCVAWHTSHCASAPIKDPRTKEVVGVITVIGYLRSAHPHSLALVKTASNTIVRLIEQQGLKKEQHMLNNYFSAAIDSVSDGILIVNRFGEVVRTNKMASHLLKIPTYEGGNIKLNEIEKLKPLKKHLEDTGEDSEVIIQDQFSLPHEGNIKLLLTSRKIIVSEEHIGNIIILRKKVSKELKKMKAKHRFSSLIGEDRRFKRAVKLATKAAETDKYVLIIGESGTGKELFAQAIHNDSSRQIEPFLAINCAAIPKDLIASELFGYAEGAFTNAAKGGKKGKFEAAHGGTIFLDEIGDMPLELQANLLRVLEEQEITPVGSNISKPIDVRIIAATNKDLFKLVKENKFRLDLFYRLNVISVKIPPLHKRKQDIELLSRHLLPSKQISADVLKSFLEYEWPGNLREMKNVLEQMDIFCDEELITAEYLPQYIQEQLEEIQDPANLYQSLADQTKKDTMIITLRNSKSVAATAKKLGVSSSTIYRWANEYQLNIKELLNSE